MELFLKLQAILNFSPIKLLILSLQINWLGKKIPSYLSSLINLPEKPQLPQFILNKSLAEYPFQKMNPNTTTKLSMTLSSVNSLQCYQFPDIWVKKLTLFQRIWERTSNYHQGTVLTYIFKNTS